MTRARLCAEREDGWRITTIRAQSPFRRGSLDDVVPAPDHVPALLLGHRPSLDRPFLDVVPVPLLSSEPPSALVLGGVMQPWRPVGGEKGEVLATVAYRAEARATAS